MNKYVLLLFGSLFFLEWDIGFIPRAIKLMPELLSGVAVAIILGRVALKNAVMIQPKYLILIVSMFFLMFASVVINYVQPGAVFAGIRTYAKHIPIFLLPIVMIFLKRK